MARYEELTVGTLLIGDPDDGSARATPYSPSGKSLTAATTLTRNDNGRTFYLNLAAGFAVTLPDPAELNPGWRCRIVVGTVPSVGDYTVVTNGGDNLIDGMADVASTLVPAANEDTITFGSAALSGDYVELESDGTNWYVNGQAVTTAAIAFTAT